MAPPLHPLHTQTRFVFPIHLTEPTDTAFWLTWPALKRQHDDTILGQKVQNRFVPFGHLYKSQTETPPENVSVVLPLPSTPNTLPKVGRPPFAAQFVEHDKVLIQMRTPESAHQLAQASEELADIKNPEELRKWYEHCQALISPGSIVPIAWHQPKMYKTPCHEAPPEAAMAITAAIVRRAVLASESGLPVEASNNILMIDRALQKYHIHAYQRVPQ